MTLEYISLPFCPGTQALGFLALLMPTHAVALGEGDWAAWLPAWLELKDRIAHCRWWDTTWMDLFSRVAKHDKHGAAPALPPLRPRVQGIMVAGVGAELELLR